MDITPWMEWYLGCLGRAIDGARETLGAVLDKKEFWTRFKEVKFNERQLIVFNRVLDGFEGNLTTPKYAALAKCSQDTAHRDIFGLIEHHVLALGTPRADAATPIHSRGRNRPIDHT